ncbi:MAG: hypothetical protein NVS3B16_23860 [Vulcanimicrobiaceae bacterium]
MTISLGTRADLLEAIAHGGAVALSAYVLPAKSGVVRALEGAADRGARVAVTLDGAPYFGATAKGAPNPNLATAAECARTARASV